MHERGAVLASTASRLPVGWERSCAQHGGAWITVNSLGERFENGFSGEEEVAGEAALMADKTMGLPVPSTSGCLTR